MADRSSFKIKMSNACYLQLLLYYYNFFSLLEVLYIIYIFYGNHHEGFFFVMHCSSPVTYENQNMVRYTI